MRWIYRLSIILACLWSGPAWSQAIQYLNQQGQPGTVPVSPQSPLPVTGTGTIGITPTDHTITSASGSSQQIMAANVSRHSLTMVNTGNANCGVNPTGGTAVIGGAGTFTLVPNGSYTPRVPTLSAVTVICTSGQPLYADDN
jgi:hypothetical protein